MIEYRDFHSLRYDYLIRRVLRALAEVGQPEVLVAGPSHEVGLIEENIAGVRVDTLGYLDHRFATRTGEHFECDLNLAGHELKMPRLPTCHLVVMAEVVEHLQTNPSSAIGFLAKALRPGGRLLIQTPNAASLAKRWNLLRGRNPFMVIPPKPDASQHWREYTAGELAAAAQEAGLDVERVEIDNLYRHEGRRAAMYLAISRFAPSSFRDCITMSLVRP